jgi:uncharacterized lipoprotein YddW (UPF0748 family)
MRYLGTLLLGVLMMAGLLVACGDDEPTAELSNARLIESFVFEQFTPQVVGEIDHANGVVRLKTPFQESRNNLIPTITVSEGATIEPASGVAQDFRTFKLYTVTAANGAKKVYTVIVEEGESNIARITSFSFPEIWISQTLLQGTTAFTVNMPFGSDLSNVLVNMTFAEPGTSVVPASGSRVDFSQPVTFTVTAPDQFTTATYTVTFNVGQPETGIRGVWLTNVDSDVLTSQAKIQAAVDLCAELNINTIFAVTLNKAVTMYPSQVMQDLTGTRIDPLYGTRDPLRELIDAAHAKNIKVFAWFEYGFAANNGSPGPILNAKPEWAAINSSGQQVVKNGFYWMNSLFPEVQDFITDLVLEVVTNYPDIDGIQGDDRLPAMPTEGGYDAYTVAKYQAEHGGASPPTNRQNTAWVQWRANILNAWAEELYGKVKAINPNCLVAMSPSPLNFGLVEYLQDYTKWVQGGYCDIVSPQLYRRDNQGLSVYTALLDDQRNRVGAAHQSKFYPGLLSYLSSYTPTEQFLADMIRENRKRGINGEVHFFYNILLVRPEVFRVVYPAPATFPTF